MSFKWNHIICSVSSLIHFVTCIGSSFLLNAELCSINDLFIHSPIDGHLCIFQFLVIIAKATINIYLQMFVWTYGFISLRQMPSWVAGSHSECIFNFIRAKLFLATVIHHSLLAKDQC